MSTSKSTIVCSVLVLALLGSSACVYFNTYYNAQKYFRQAEKARLQQEEMERGLTDPRRQRRSRGSADLYDQAARQAAKVLEKFPESELVDDAMLLMGRAFYWQGDYKNAIETFIDLETSFPESEFFDWARYWRALSYAAQNEGSQAQELLRSIFNEATPGIAVLAGQQLGKTAVEAEDFAAAIQEYSATLEVFPSGEESAELWLHLGEAIFALEDTTRYAEAQEAFARVLEEDPAADIEYRARLNQGRVLYAQGEADGALETYKKLLGDGRFRLFEGETRLLIGQSYQERSLLDEALSQYEKVRDDFPQSHSSAMALFRTGELYLQEYGDAERAEEYFKETRTEKSGSEAARLGQETLRYMGQLDRIQERIHRADSLAALQRGEVEVEPGRVTVADTLAADTLAVADTLAADTLAATDTLVAADILAAVDTLAVVDTLAMADTLVAADSLAMVDTLAAADSLGGDKGAGWFFKEERVRETDQTGSSEMLDDFFAVAELYRSNLGVADSASYYYQEIIRRFPQSVQLPRAYYGIAWIDEELKKDPAAATVHWQQLIDAYPASEQANAARRRLGQEMRVTDEELAVEEFVRIEKLRLENPQDIELYAPLLDRLTRVYPATRTAPQAAYTAAWAHQNIAVDSLGAERRFDRLLEDFPESEFAIKVKLAREGRASGALAKLERNLRELAAGSRPGERIELIAVEPDSLDTLLLARKHLRFGIRAHGHGELKTAREQYELSLDQRKGDPEAYYLLGNALWEEGYIRDAIEQYRNALDANPNHLKTFYRLFGAYTVENEIDSANRYLRRIVQSDRRNRQVQFIMEEYPDLSRGNSDLLDKEELERLALLPPEEDFELSEKQLQLADPPVVKDMVVPEYPAAARGDSAIVFLDILVGKDGKAATVEVFKGDSPFREAAVAAAQEYEFFPALDRREEKVQVWVALELPVRPGTAMSGGDGELEDGVEAKDVAEAGVEVGGKIEDEAAVEVGDGVEGEVESGAGTEDGGGAGVEAETGNNAKVEEGAKVEFEEGVEVEVEEGAEAESEEAEDDPQ